MALIFNFANPVNASEEDATGVRKCMTSTDLGAVHFFFLECGFIYIYRQHSAESLSFSYYRSVSLSLVVSRVVILERSGAHAAPWPHADRSGT